MLNRKAFFLLAGLAVPPLLPADAAAQTPNQKAEAEARSFLTPCAQPTPELQHSCLRTHQRFIREYVRAKAGDQSNIHGVGSYFTPLPGGASQSDINDKIGEPVSLFQACAWRIFYSFQPLLPHQQQQPPLTRQGMIENKRRYHEFTCAKLPPAEQLAARRRAEELMQELLSAPARMPPSDWWPKMAGLAAERPRPPIPIHCLDSRPVPLLSPGETRPPEPAFVPPKGCPGNP